MTREQDMADQPHALVVLSSDHAGRAIAEALEASGLGQPVVVTDRGPEEERVRVVVAAHSTASAQRNEAGALERLRTALQNGRQVDLVLPRYSLDAMRAAAAKRARRAARDSKR